MRVGTDLGVGTFEWLRLSFNPLGGAGCKVHEQCPPLPLCFSEVAVSFVHCSKFIPTVPALSYFYSLTVYLYFVAGGNFVQV